MFAGDILAHHLRRLLEEHEHTHGATGGVALAYGLLCAFLVTFAGLMSGLTLGLMSMDIVELEVLKRSGSELEARQAARIIPVVKDAHFLLVTLLLCNACAMEALPIFLNKLVSELVAIVVSVTAVLFMGEIFPQAICSKYGLVIGSAMSIPVRILMLITSPISFPIAKLLDWVLGGEHASLFRRKQLKALVELHARDEGFGGRLTTDEIQIITGALDLTRKTAFQAMTPLDKVFMLSTDQKLDDATISMIMAAKPFSRLPVYRGGNQQDIVGVILVKELLEYVKHFPDSTVASLKIRQLPRLNADTPMYDLLKLFRVGRSHMALLIQPYPDEDSDKESSVQGMLRRSMQLLHDQVHNTFHHTPHPPLETVPENPGVTYKPLGTSSQPIGKSGLHPEDNMLEMQGMDPRSHLPDKSQALTTAFSDGLLVSNDGSLQKPGVFSSLMANVKGLTGVHNTGNGTVPHQQQNNDSERASLLHKYEDSGKAGAGLGVQSAFASPTAQGPAALRSSVTVSPPENDRHHSSSLATHSRDHTHKHGDSSQHVVHSRDHQDRQHSHTRHTGEATRQHHHNHVDPTRPSHHHHHGHHVVGSTRDSHDTTESHRPHHHHHHQQQQPPASTPARSIRSLRSLFTRDSHPPQGTEAGQDTGKQKKRRSKRRHKKSGVMTPAPTSAPSFIDQAALDMAMEAGHSLGGAHGSVAGNSNSGIVEREPSLQSGISHAVRKLRRLKKAFSRPVDGQEGSVHEDVVQGGSEAFSSESSSSSSSSSDSTGSSRDDLEDMVPVPLIAQPGAPIGIITIEDVLEELLGMEVLDETDMWLDNERTIPVNPRNLEEALPEHLRAVLAVAERAKNSVTSRPAADQRSWLLQAASTFTGALSSVQSSGQPAKSVLADLATGMFKTFGGEPGAPGKPAIGHKRTGSLERLPLLGAISRPTAGSPMRSRILDSAGSSGTFATPSKQQSMAGTGTAARPVIGNSHRSDGGAVGTANGKAGAGGKGGDAAGAHGTLSTVPRSEIHAATVAAAVDMELQKRRSFANWKSQERSMVTLPVSATPAGINVARGNSKSSIPAVPPQAAGGNQA